jgi:hypothetical protein
MGTAEMTIAITELNGILKAGVQAVDFLSCDARVHGKGRVRTAREALALVGGGGGTDFRPVFAEAEKVRPDLLVFVTDGDGAMPTSAPAGMNVLWLLTGRYTVTPKWGEVIKMED